MTASLFERIVAFENVPSIVSEVVLSFISDVILVSLLMNVMLLLLGLFLEPLSALVVTIPGLYSAANPVGRRSHSPGCSLGIELDDRAIDPPDRPLTVVASDISEAPVESIVGELKPYYVVLLMYCSR